MEPYGSGASLSLSLSLSLISFVFVNFCNTSSNRGNRCDEEFQKSIARYFSKKIIEQDE
ncbi:hypothetical protein I3843_02G028200 [Carya illinoinensis]|uniref:Uncharacterized protein n=1 Tax=Carya illinoinensis TaxID=32201 RepID=A0A922K3E2_CARIL|nr:hypothetical protein I3842_02G036000 [Carya illinoinensis]KAG7990498.1 hypothetical protein I3843_02G028200 [Carya illinoinensis]